MSEGKTFTVTSENFESEVLNHPQPVLLDFWAEWCGPCKMIAPVLDELADDYGDRVRIAKVNIDQHQDLAAKHNVTSIPTLLIYKGGEVQEQFAGARSKSDLKSKLDEAIG